MRVPPDQSGTDRDTAARASSGRAARSCLVIRVELGREQEGFDAAVALRHGVREVQQHARVALHRAADVAQQHERRAAARAVAAAAARRCRRRCGGCRRWRAADRFANPRPRTHRRVRRTPGFQTSCESGAARLGDFFAGERGEVLVGEAAAVAPDQAAFRRRLVFRVVEPGRRVGTMKRSHLRDFDRLGGRGVASPGVRGISLS